MPGEQLAVLWPGAAFYPIRPSIFWRWRTGWNAGASETYRPSRVLLTSQEEYEAFRARHAKATVPRVPPAPTMPPPVHIGIDSGSTTVKMASVDQEARILLY